MEHFYEYEEFTGSIEYDQKSNTYFGKILDIAYDITYTGKTIEELYEQFKKAVHKIWQDDMDENFLVLEKCDIRRIDFKKSTRYELKLSCFESNTGRKINQIPVLLHVGDLRNLRNTCDELLKEYDTKE